MIISNKLPVKHCLRHNNVTNISANKNLVLLSDAAQQFFLEIENHNTPYSFNLSILSFNRSLTNKCAKGCIWNLFVLIDFHHMLDLNIDDSLTT